jgi:hypothetical protein
MSAFHPLRTLAKRCKNQLMSDDWRTEVLETLPYLRGHNFVRKPYTAYRPEISHASERGQ